MVEFEIFSKERLDLLRVTFVHDGEHDTVKRFDLLEELGLSALRLDGKAGEEEEQGR